ncbi:hypothetical protein IIA15_11295 [candidate division TA06 bacterium]|nr:hypothetical protein [candidate division TA06 bacterium]
MKKKTHDVFGTWRRSIKPPLVKFAHVFIRPGPYEPVYTERVSKMYSRGIGFQYGQMVDYLLKKMQVD